MIAFLLFIFLTPSVLSIKVCFDPYGCYSLDAPWWSLPSRPFAQLPQAPHIINTRFLLFTRADVEEVELVINKTGILKFSDFDGSRNTRIIIHGFLAKKTDSWVTSLKNELLKYEDCNVIIVEWSDGAGLPYMQATANTRVVADQLRHLLMFINREMKQPFTQMHLIGHGLGAHLAGYVGKKVKNLGRITGLDPVQPYFSGQDSIIRLDSGDAQYVDIIHTDGSTWTNLGFGMDQPLGHVDFYPNEGKSQPGCSLIDKIKGGFWDALRINLIGSAQAIACEHMRSIDLFIESISTKCPFVAFKCNNAKAFNSGECKHCEEGTCTRFGFHSDKFPARGNMYLTTNGRAPFCHYSFVTSVTTAAKQPGTSGEISAKIVGKSGMSEFFRVNNDGSSIKKSTTYSTVGVGKIDMGNVNYINLKYDDKSFLFKQDLFVDKVVVSAIDQDLGSTHHEFCSKAVKVANGKTVKLEQKSCL